MKKIIDQPRVTCLATCLSFFFATVLEGWTSSLQLCCVFFFLQLIAALWCSHLQPGFWITASTPLWTAHCRDSLKVNIGQWVPHRTLSRFHSANKLAFSHRLSGPELPRTCLVSEDSVRPIGPSSRCYLVHRSLGTFFPYS